MLGATRSRFATRPAARPGECRWARARSPGSNWELDRERGRRRARLRAAVAELDRRRLQPRLRARLPRPRPRPARCTSRGSAPRSCSGRAEEFSFCELAEEFSSGSSIMPQKKNPDAAELLRGQGAADLVELPRPLPACCTACRSPTRRTCRRTRRRSSTPSTPSSCASRPRSAMLAGLSFDRERLAEAAADELLAATDVADLLVRKGMPFREAHGVVGELVREALEQGKAALRAHPRGARRALRAARRRVLRGARRGAAGWSRSAPPAARRPPRSPSSSTARGGAGRARGGTEG